MTYQWHNAIRAPVGAPLLNPYQRAGFTNITWRKPLFLSRFLKVPFLNQALYHIELFIIAHDDNIIINPLECRWFSLSVTPGHHDQS